MQVEEYRRGLIRSPTAPHHETIHSGHFMVSDFEAEAQDDEFEVAVPVPEGNLGDDNLVASGDGSMSENMASDLGRRTMVSPSAAGLTIETSLTKLFRCMTLAYRQKLTSPKWNRFRGIRLRWKDKIRLNNVIWRCWHMQFIKKENTLICQFASPLDEGVHNKPEAVVLEGKYWKRKLAAVTAEYKRWRMFYRNKIMGWACKDTSWIDIERGWKNQTTGSENFPPMMIDEDYMDLMSDTLFSTISSNQPFAFPDIREIARNANLADFIQPSLVQLQPNLDDFMDTLEPLQEFFTSKLPPVPEDCVVTNISYSAPQSSVPIPSPSVVVSNIAPEIAGAQLQSVAANPEPFNFGEQPHKSNRVYVKKDQPETVYFRTDHPADTFETRQIGSGCLPGVNTYRYPHPRNIAPAPLPQTVPNYSQNLLPLNYELLSTRLVPETSTGSLAVHSKPFERSTSLPSVARDENFAVPKHVHMKNNRHRSRSGSSLLAAASKQVRPPPPLVNSNSDPSLNLPNKSALLAQLLTTTSNVATGSFAKSAISGSMLSVPSVGSNSQGYPSSSINPGSPNSPDNRLQPISPPACSSPQSPMRTPSSERSRVSLQEPKKSCHSNAEQKRRYNIRNGFDVLHSLIPHLQQNPSAKLSKAALLQKGAEYIRQLQMERKQHKEEIETLKYQIEMLSTSIANSQSLLPATGAPVSRHRTSRMLDMFRDFVRIRTSHNWRFWIFSLLFEPLLQSFNCSVSTASFEDLHRSTLMWVEQHCSLVDLRPAVINSLRILSTTTDILTEPQKLPEEARAAVMQSKLNPS